MTWLLRVLRMSHTTEEGGEEGGELLAFLSLALGLIQSIGILSDHKSVGRDSNRETLLA